MQGSGAMVLVSVLGLGLVAVVYITRWFNLERVRGSLSGGRARAMHWWDSSRISSIP